MCKKCGESVSGPDEADVKATMKRHEDKKHPQARRAVGGKK